jgi:hypothetical protein
MRSAYVEICAETAVICLKALSFYSPHGIKKNKSASEWVVLPPTFEPGTSRIQVRRVSAVLICLTVPLPLVPASQFPLYVSCPDILKYEAKKTTKTNLSDLFPLLGSNQTTLYNGNDRLATTLLPCKADSLMPCCIPGRPSSVIFVFIPPPLSAIRLHS